jgi:serine/threonine protein kinase
VETPEHWARIKEIFGGALECAPADRGSFLDDACAQEPTLRAEVESLLAAHAEADAVFLSGHPQSNTTSQLADHLRAIGPYRLIRELGAGGMGQVWLAEQTEPLHRHVALKLIKAGTYDSTTIQRFRTERQSLAIMEHPAIAKVFDAGTTPHLTLPNLLTKWGRCLLAMKQTEEARSTVQDAIRLYAKTLNTDDSRTRAAEKLLAQAN